ncbi:hypothetical protein FB45DRAFT_703516, partial [Roridomyces roridus]
RITRWLKYRVRKLNKSIVRKANNADSPYYVLMARLAGSLKPPKARQAYQQFQHERVADLRGATTNQWKPKDDGKGPKAGVRGAVAREAFKALPVAEQKAYAKRATDEAAERKADYLKALNDGPETTPEARQKCIDNLGGFLGAIMKGVTEYTGLQSLVVVGGPMPKYNGEISTLHLAVGRNNATVLVSFPAWDKDRFQTEVTDFMKDYLQTAYSES